MIGKNIPEKIKKFEEAVRLFNLTEARDLLLKNEVVWNQAPTHSLISLMYHAIFSHTFGIVEPLLEIDRVRKEIAKDWEILITLRERGHPGSARFILEKIWKEEEDFTSLFKDSYGVVLHYYKDFASQTLEEQSYAMAKTMSEIGLPEELISISCQYQNSFDLLTEQESQQAIAAGIKLATWEIQQDKEKLERDAREKAEREARDAKEKHAKEKQKKTIQEDYDYAYALSLSNGGSRSVQDAEQINRDFAYALSLSDQKSRHKKR